MFSFVMLPPHTPHPMLDVIGMPLVNVPAFELDCTCRTIMRLTGATQGQTMNVVIVERVDAAGVAFTAGLEDLADHAERLVEPVVAEDRQDRAELLRREPMLAADVPFFDDQEGLVLGDAESGPG